MRESERSYYGIEEDTGLPSERRLQTYGERGLYSQGKGGIHPCISRSLSGRHILLIGTTGSGKTYAAAYMAKYLDAFIFINTQQEKEASLVCQVRLDDPSEVQDAFEEGYRKIEYMPSLDKDAAKVEVEIIREGLFEIGAEIKAQSNEIEIPMWVTVFLDETQVYAPIRTHLDAENFWDMGRGYGIRGVAISRQPQELSKDVVNNCEFELIFKLGHYAEPYFKAFKIPIEEHKAWLARKHHFLLYDKESMYHCGPIT